MLGAWTHYKLYFHILYCLSQEKSGSYFTENSTLDVVHIKNSKDRLTWILNIINNTLMVIDRTDEHCTDLTHTIHIIICNTLYEENPCYFTCYLLWLFGVRFLQLLINVPKVMDFSGILNLSSFNKEITNIVL